MSRGHSSGVGATEYVPDHLYERLFQPWMLPQSEWPLCKEDWQRVDAITALPWMGRLLDVGAGDGTLAAMVMSRNPMVSRIAGVEHDCLLYEKFENNFGDNRVGYTWPIFIGSHVPTKADFKDEYLPPYDGALCCEVLEHNSPDDGQTILSDIKRVLNPGAMLCVTVPRHDGSRANYPGHVSFFEEEGLCLMLEDAGFMFPHIYDISGIWIMAVCHV